MYKFGLSVGGGQCFASSPKDQGGEVGALPVWKHCELLKYPVVGESTAILKT